MTHDPAEALRKIADEIFERWDKDQRSGKLLTALAGRLPGYRADVDAVLAALAPPAPAGGEVRKSNGVLRIREALLDAATIFENIGYVDSANRSRAAVEAFDNPSGDAASITSPPSPDVAGVVERLRTFADDYVETSEIANLMNEASTSRPQRDQSAAPAPSPQRMDHDEQL